MQSKICKSKSRENTDKISKAILFKKLRLSKKFLRKILHLGKSQFGAGILKFDYNSNVICETVFRA